MICQPAVVLVPAFSGEFPSNALGFGAGLGWGGVPDTEANEALKGLPPSSGIVWGFAT